MRRLAPCTCRQSCPRRLPGALPTVDEFEPPQPDPSRKRRVADDVKARSHRRIEVHDLTGMTISVTAAGASAKKEVAREREVRADKTKALTKAAKIRS